MIPLNKLKKSEAKKFIGKTKGDKVEFDIEKTFEDNAAIAHATGLPMEEAENKKGKFELEVTSISRSEPAPLDEEFFSKLFGKNAVKTVDEFNAKLKETITENYNKEAENLLNHDIQDHFVKETKIDLPDAFLKHWLYVSNNGKITEDQIEKEYNLYVNEVKWNLIKNKIAEGSDLKVDNQEVIDKTKEMIGQQFGNMNFGDEMAETFNKIADNYLKQDNGKNYMKMFEQVFLDKVLSLIKGKISLQEKQINVDEFKKIASAK
jgi:trigger factor